MKSSQRRTPENGRLTAVEPIIVERDPQPSVGRREPVTMTEFARIADHLPGLIGWLMARGAEITGPPTGEEPAGQTLADN
jgi:hypothetical protein